MWKIVENGIHVFYFFWVTLTFPNGTELKEHSISILLIFDEKTSGDMNSDRQNDDCTCINASPKFFEGV
jgi:hypothetical protein